MRFTLALRFVSTEQVSSLIWRLKTWLQNHCKSAWSLKILCTFFFLSLPHFPQKYSVLISICSPSSAHQCRKSSRGVKLGRNRGKNKRRMLYHTKYNNCQGKGWLRGKLRYTCRDAGKACRSEDTCWLIAWESGTCRWESEHEGHERVGDGEKYVKKLKRGGRARRLMAGDNRLGALSFKMPKTREAHPKTH